jgi:hypothetical protein
MLEFIKRVWKQTITCTLETAKTVSKAFLSSKPVLILKFTFNWLGDVYIRLEFT